MNQHRSLTRLAAAAGAAALTMLALAPAASAADPDAHLASTTQTVYETYQQCPITQIGGQLFRCDVATGGGVRAPAHVPQGAHSTNG
ncbi:hypothetical protein FE374_07850 [Georgenia yuyongxinii]|uniref:DUF4333 domain-containing protein n=1 Tax=Georgenia yuyongxinii TaxID=2589797 RepID=A0A5B8C1D5_9MICO|nr:hypothetical protein [Georgenia yuyongxinii]QDC24549.1 hypothetical protein FE374_07850 [Georgenia yuyongxinii]